MQGPLVRTCGLWRAGPLCSSSDTLSKPAPLAQCRTTKNCQSADFIFARLPDRIVILLLFMTLYLGIGDRFKDDNIVSGPRVRRQA